MCLVTCRRKKCIVRLFCAAFITGVILFIVRIRQAINEMKCDNAQLEDMLSSLCTSYKNGHVAGSLCMPLCDLKEVHYIKCLNYKQGKKIAFSSWNDKTVILKAKHTEPSSREVLQFFPNIGDFMIHVRSKVNEDFGIIDTRNDQDLLFHLWTGSESIEDLANTQALDIDKISQQHRVMRSLWSLLQQDEYIFLQYFSNNHYLPRIYGSCGHLYAMEYAPSTGILDPDILQYTIFSTYSWHERVKIALDLLQILKTADEDFGEPLHFCDVKGSNFGIGQDGHVKPIDTDTVFLRSKLEQSMHYTESCNESSDCDFFDCQGFCNRTTHKCWPKVMNSNLEAVCRKIFCQRKENMYAGLLSHPPSQFQSRLDSVLNECLSLTDGEAGRSEQVFHTLYSLLQESNAFL